MKILIDMNLAPAWCDVFRAEGWTAEHWSTVGDPRATDAQIMNWARQHQCIVFTNDLDFGTALALTRAVGPSVVQVRTQNIMPARLGPLVIALLHVHADALRRGALIVVDEARARLRLLPLEPS